jgi:hypothetical protein
LPVPQPPDDFFLATPPMPARSCCFLKCSPGGTSPSSPFPMTTARCSAVF